MKVSKETHEALTALGRKGESYDAIIRRLLQAEQDLKDARIRLAYIETRLEEKEDSGR